MYTWCGFLIEFGSKYTFEEFWKYGLFLVRNTKLFDYDQLMWSSRSRISQVQVQVEVHVIPESNCTCLDFYHEASGGPSIERHSCLKLLRKNI